MLEWISANIANILIMAGVIAIVVLAVALMVRDRKAGRSSCGCGCANCAMAGKCHSAAAAAKTKK